MSSSTKDQPTPRQRRSAATRRQIMDAALAIAQQDGWSAVTTRRLAAAIDYTQPVLYQHFTNRDALLRAIAVDGFTTLTESVQAAAATGGVPLDAICRAYLDFAMTEPRVYELMFSLPIGIRFDSPTTPAPVRETFDALTALIQREHHTGDPNAAAEFFWASCHGLACLITAGRIPTDRIDAHIARTVHSIEGP